MTGEYALSSPIVPESMPAGVRIHATTRAMAGFSTGPYERCNLGIRAGDDPELVMRNRAALVDALELPAEPLWLDQVHGIDVIDADAPDGATSCADASFTRARGRVLAVLTADCLPVVLAAEDASVVGVVHAGWRGLSAGVIEACLARLDVPAARVVAWLGPAISPKHYEVGEEVRAAFLAHDAGADTAFAATRPGHWSCDLYALARRRLARAGVAQTTGGEHCTHADAARFYSYRRDGETGRIATLAWLER